VFSFRGREDIAALELQTAERPAARGAQRALAEEMTTLVHGAGELDRVQAASQALFGQGDLRGLDESTLASALAEVPSVTLEPADVQAGLPPVADLMAAAGIVGSKSAARRAIDEGGAYLNNEKVTSPDAAPSPRDLLHGRFLVLRRGKRTVAGVRASLGELPGLTTARVTDSDLTRSP
jgi:tyrosyl-tRNA synthetase